MEELKEVVHSMQKGKSTGLDGWPVDFFSGFMESFEVDLLTIIEESNIRCINLSTFSYTFITCRGL